MPLREHKISPFPCGVQPRPCPFRCGFNLERALLTDAALVPLKIKKQPKSGQGSHNIKTLEVKITAKKMILVFLQAVLPPLLKIEWTQPKSVTLEELFAWEIWEAVTEVKERIIKGEKLSFRWPSTGRLGSGPGKSCERRASMWCYRIRARTYIS